MPDGQEAAKERGQRAFVAWLRTSLPEDQVQKILTSGTLYNGYAQIFADYVASGQITQEAIQTLLQTAATTPETAAVSSKLTQAQAELSNWMLGEYKSKYLPWQITNQGLTEDEADVLYSELRDSLFPKIPQTQEEKLAWYQKTIGQAPPYKLDTSGNMTVDWSAIDSVLAAKGAQPYPVTQTKQYRDFTSWREGQLSGYEKQLSKYQEGLAKEKLIQASQIASDYGIPQSAIQGLAPDMADQWMQAQWQTQMARSKQEQEQQTKYQADLTTARMEAESRRIAAQQEAHRQQEIQRIDQRTQEKLLPMPDTETQYSEAVKGLVSPAMQQFYKGQYGSTYQAAGMEEAMLQWWKILNSPIIEEGEAMKAAIGRPDALGYADTTGLQEQFGISGREAYGAVERYAYNPNAPEFETLPTGGREVLAGTLAAGAVEAEGGGGEDYAGALARLQKQSSPWENYLTRKDWFTEFLSTPRAYRPGGYTRRSLAPSIRRF